MGVKYVTADGAFKSLVHFIYPVSRLLCGYHELEAA